MRESRRSHHSIWHRLAAALAVALVAAVVAASPVGAQSSGGVLARHYRAGDSLHYQMDATNQDRETLVAYSARADGVVLHDSLGRFVEDFEWSHLVRNGSAIDLPAGAAGVRERLTLAPEFMLPPDVAHTNPALIGPVLDLLTFYVDLWLSAKMPLAHARDHALVPGHGANSWADGHRVMLGEDAVDFDITLNAVDSTAGVARLEVRHVPTSDSHIRLPAEWMRAPLFSTPNNWVEITHASNGSYIAGVGRETFDVQLVLSLADGHIISATMDNPVDVLERTCTDAELTACADATRYRILRRITLQQRNPGRS